MTGAARPGNVYRFSLPRSDPTVTLDGVAMLAPHAPAVYFEGAFGTVRQRLRPE